MAYSEWYNFPSRVGRLGHWLYQHWWKLKISVWLNEHQWEEILGKENYNLSLFWPKKYPLFLKNANFANSCPASNLPPYFRANWNIHGAINSHELGDWGSTWEGSDVRTQVLLAIQHLEKRQQNVSHCDKYKKINEREPTYSTNTLPSSR